LSSLNANLAPRELIDAIVSCALVYEGAIQTLAAMWEIKKGSTFGGIAFSSHGGFWMSLGLILLLEVLGIWAIPTVVLGVFLLG
jgi:hypothetical protein